MAVPTDLFPATYRPQLRADLHFGPPLIMRGNITYVMKDASTGWYYEIDSVEYFILSRMDGTRTLAEIDEEIARHYGHGLSADAWQALFKQINQRQWLADRVDQERLAVLKAMERHRRWSEHQTLLRHRFALVHPDHLLSFLLRYLGFAFHPLFVIPALVAIVVAEVYILFHVQALLLTIWQSPKSSSSVLSYLIFLLLLYVLPVFHETAHGLACKRFGGSISEMGIIWRYLSFFPYCKLDDIVLMHNRWHRVYAAFAGTFFSLLVLLPFWVLWLTLPPSSPWRVLSALMLTLYNIGMLINFLPFVELDGYFMLAHLLDMPDLRQASNEFWLHKIVKIIFKREVPSHHARPFGTHGLRIYFYYGIASIVLTALFIGMSLLGWFRTIRGIVGDTITWMIIGALALYVLYQLVSFSYRLLALCLAPAVETPVHPPLKHFSNAPHDG